MMEEEAEQGFPIRVVVVLLMVAVALIGWCCMASQYAHDVENQRLEVMGIPTSSRITRGNGRAMMIYALVELLSNGVRQLPNMGAVLSFNFQHRIWLPVLVGVVEVLALGTGLGLKHLEQKLEDPPLKKKKKKKRKQEGFESPW